MGPKLKVAYTVCGMVYHSVGPVAFLFIEMSWLIMISPEGRLLGLVLGAVLICVILRVSSWARYGRDALFCAVLRVSSWVGYRRDALICSVLRAGSWAGYMGCFNLFSPGSQYLGWVWVVLICSVVRVSSWAGYGFWNALICSVLRVGGWVGYGML
jgi:hypothetical protein